MWECVYVCVCLCLCVFSCLNSKHIEGQWAMCAGRELGQWLPRQLWLAALINLWPHRVIGHKKEIIRH